MTRVRILCIALVSILAFMVIPASGTHRIKARLETRVAGDCAIRVQPQNTTVDVGETFSLGVTFENVEASLNVVGFQFTLSWNESVLQAINMAEVLFHTITPESEWGNIWNLRLLISNGSAAYAITWGDISRAINMGYAPVSILRGTLASITFRSLAKGQAVMHLQDVVIGDKDANAIPNVAIDGTVYVSPTVVPVWPLTIDSVSPASGVPGTIVTVQGRGASGQELRIYFDDTIVATLLGQRGNWDISFKVPNVDPGSHKITAVVDALLPAKAIAMFTVNAAVVSVSWAPTIIIFFIGGALVSGIISLILLISIFQKRKKFLHPGRP